MRTIRIDKETLIALNENDVHVGTIRRMQWVSGKISFVWDTAENQIVTDTMLQMMWELSFYYRATVTLDHVPRSVFVMLLIMCRVLREGK